MNSLRTHIKAALFELHKNDNNSEKYSLIQKLAVLSEADKSLCSDRFTELAASLADYGHTDYIEQADIDALHRMFEADEVLIEASRNEIDSELATFELDQEDKDTLLKKCEQMRKIIWASTAFDQAHRGRLLKRVSAMEVQIGLEKGLCDVVLGGVSDFGEVLGKFGEDIKPLTDRMRDIAQITRSKSADYDKLPAPEETKKLTRK
ncbi:MAG: hypothetical protein ABJH45_08565 [Paracoccaceae bacterium]